MRLTRFDVGGFCAFLPIMVSLVYGFGQGIFVWLVSAGQVSLAILSFALRRGQLTSVMNCETNSFRLTS